VTAPGGDAAVQAVTDRLQVWLNAVHAEVDTAQEAARDGGDRAAVSYLDLIGLRVRSHRD
jgi:hypothetical protein